MYCVPTKFVPRLLTEVQKKSIMSESVRSCLFVQMFMKTFWKSHNKWGNIGVQVQCPNKKTNHCSGWKIVTMTKKSMSELLKCKGDVDRFYIGRAIFVMSLLHVFRLLIESFTWRLWSFWRKQCKRRVLRHGQTKPGCCTMTMHPFMRCSLSMTFGEAQDDCHPPNHPTVQIWPLRTFLISKVEIHLERLLVSNDKRR